MKRCIITIKLLFYIILFNKWNDLEAKPTSDTSSTTVVTLDINKTSSTNDFEYSKSDNYRTYTPKPGKSFSKIVKKKKDIWTSQNNHAVKVVLIGSGKTPKHLVILLTTRNFVLLYKTGKNKPWEDITSKRHDVSKLKFFGDNNTELKSSDYEITIVNKFLNYTFNDGVKCLTVNLGDNVVWSHSDHSNFKEIKAFSLDLYLNNFFVKNKSDQLKQIKPKLKPVDLDIDKKESTEQSDYKDENGVNTWTPKFGYGFNKISAGETAIWNSNDVYSTMVTIKSEGTNKYLIILLNNDSFSIFKQSDGKSWENISKHGTFFTSIRFYGDNNRELRPSDYKIDIVNTSVSFTFNSGVNCTKIMFGDDEWSQKDHTQSNLIKSLSLDFVSNSLTIALQSGTMNLKFDPTTSGGQTTTTGTGQTGTSPATGQDGTGTGTGASTTPAGQTTTGGSQPATGTNQTTTTPASEGQTTTTPKSGSSPTATGTTTTPKSGSSPTAIGTTT
ncbi:hypothetical protein TpMuguga_02g00001 [Theileria parva strain Muguga]|uniref:Hypothetical telomeric SfiI 1 protein 1 n=1 Tax=Theileria parva TaxID=5875 RepID=Q9GQU3_THEPA|nr:uncharacterized protein TpMuguga_02g00001 [Theileria parva strain Muguga]AAG37805.1 hypothetical telomeric SfiI fragment 1 protein1 [Theileria parva]EAN32287.1 hypothetical protein TpMuguga_02g00001 [Theileria parva strain Muguga]|eukprot:XP_764570.1 hypothetical protein [Theileria parva strain Muguga]